MTEKTETKNITRTITNNNPSPTKFGGLIFFSDFETEHRGKNQNSSSIAKRIISDRNFDRQCKINAENRNKYKKINKKENL